LEHPDARDSAEGILVWWLPPNSKVTQLEVEEALSALVDQGWVQTRGESEVHLFGLEAAAMKEIDAYLQRERERG
jgi:hypothetical protein